MDDPTAFGDGRFRVAHALGEGGMARVFRAWDTRLSAWRAIKAMAPEYAGKKALRERFRREARAMAALEHPNIVRVYDVVDEGDVPFIVMELVEGGSLEDWVQKHGKMPPQLAVTAMIAACAGVQAAHDRGVVHRDLKPANVLVGLDNRCRIADFGIAHIEDDGGGKKTRTGMVMGTMGYMAPEQSVDAKRADARSDVYALGATLLHLLTGNSPVHMFSVVEPQVFEGLPERLGVVVRRATALRMDDRYPTIDAFAAALSDVRASVPQDPPGTPPLAAPARPAPPIPAAATASPVPKPAAAPAVPPPADRPAPAPPTLGPMIAGETAVPPVDDEATDVKIRKLHALAGYAGRQEAAPKPTKSNPPVLATDRPYEVHDDVGSSLRPEYIELTDEERLIAEEARRREGKAEEEGEDGATKVVSNTALNMVKVVAEYCVRVALVFIDFMMGKGLIIMIPAAVIAVGVMVKGHSTNTEMAEVEVKLVSSRQSFLAAMESDPTLAQELIALGASASVIERAQVKLAAAKTEAERGAAASDLIRVQQMQYDKLMKTAPPSDRIALQALERRMEKLVNACDRFDADRFGLTELCESASGQFVAGFGFGPCGEVTE